MRLAQGPFIAVVLLLATHTLAAQEKEQQKIDSLITQLYKALSFADGAWKDAEQAKVFFFGEGRLVANFGDAPQARTLNEYIASVRENIQKQRVSVVEEKEVYQRTDVFGNVAQRLSTYALRLEAKDKVIIRNGINLFQLLKVDGQWKVYGLIWDRESGDLKIPAEFKPK